jgi:DNA-binding transcriptional ArsR family regulator
VTDRPRGLRELDRIDAVFGALAHRNRRQILTVLRVRGGTLTAGQLAARFDCTWPTTTRHLNVLTEAGLVRVEQHGRERHYSVVVEELTSVAANWIARFERSENTDNDETRTRFHSCAEPEHPVAGGLVT